MRIKCGTYLWSKVLLCIASSLVSWKDEKEKPLYNTIVENHKVQWILLNCQQGFVGIEMNVVSKQKLSVKYKSKVSSLVLWS